MPHKIYLRNQWIGLKHQVYDNIFQNQYKFLLYRLVPSIFTIKLKFFCKYFFVYNKQKNIELYKP